MFLQITGPGSRQLRDIAVDLKREGEVGLSRRLRRQIVAEANILKMQVAAAALAIPAKSTGAPPLRPAIAASLRVSVSPMIRNGSGVRLIADGKKMPAGKQSLPAYMEGSDGFRSLRWRHPLFGTHKWYPQDSHPYFIPTVIQHYAAIEAAVLRAVDETARALAA